MNLTRSIRRKLAVALGLLLIAQIGLFSASLIGLLDYRALVRDLEIAVNEAPRKSELQAAMSQLVDPLAVPLLGDNEPEARRAAQAKFQRDQFARVIQSVATDVRTYFTRLDLFHRQRSIPISLDVELSLANQQARMLEKLRAMNGSLAGLEDSRKRGDTFVYIGKRLAELNDIANATIDPLAEVQPMLANAKRCYHTHFWLVSVAGVSATGLLLITIGVAFRWVYQPIKRLHAVAESVAQGNFDKRAKVCGTTDELAQLAHALNVMIERFQTSIADRDREIAQRSQQLIQSARLADTGFLAAGIAHEVNNPLAGVGYAAESLQMRVAELLEVDDETGTIPTPDEQDLKVVNNYLEMISRETSRIRELTEKMKDFGRRDPGESEGERYRYDITAIVAEVISLIGHMKRYEDRTIVFHPEEPIYALVVASQIKQVMLNLIANALDAVGPGGRLEIAVAHCPDVVRLTFADDGVGMDADTLEHIFDPFFTTKLGQDGTEKGTGLGLAISHRIVVDHGGTLEATSDGPGEGTTFELRLPKAAASAQAA